MLKGKLAIVTGATSGIGAATARVFMREGAKVIASGRNDYALRELASETGCTTVQCDLSQQGAGKTLVSEAVAALGGKLTTVVNCAGVLVPGGIGVEAGRVASMEDFQSNFAVNTQGVFEMMVESVPHLKAAGVDAGPSIVNVSSVNGLQSFGGVATYCASKAAVDMLTRCAAVDLAPFGVRCNAVNPGLVLTELQKRGGLDEKAYEAFVKRGVEVTHPLGAALGRPALPEEVADLIAFLASDKALFITGDCVKIDGGRACMGAR